MTSLQEDKKIIAENGGATELARKLNYRSHRVQNWTVRGIPAKEKLKFPEIFLTPKTEQKKTSVA
ncbi:hypothetical protein ABTC40_02970 [Acinetobacter baumannii]|uniref:hypothetical protein n=1 Tax=Acinetobacter baumannii TaxID=470 RepID=UPI00044F47B4|nr:hypothetical protein [Acinetobacter baumannii]EXI40228.1 hypothetical protein J647_0005 [Acinetobacter baumannii 846928]MCT9423399.1 hypothetical protein [Acinetobacter baumannii]MDC4371713.1 hypothetical protein [Acinetobacter baumannii]MDC5174115.1 hypothetical protein [Acinetobacter baumannii]MDH2581039.1 hypothetical protein [Acinetobacter baumannii]